MEFFAGPRPRVFGHRGAAGVAPENTLVSFSRALADGAPYLELDVRASADGEVVVIHDATVDRTTDGKGPVAALRLDELRRLDAGYRFTAPDGSHPYRGRGVRIPTLAELLAAFPEARLNIEVKQEEPAIEAAVAAVLRAGGGTGRVLLAAENDVIIKRLRAAMPEAPTSFSAGEVAEFVSVVVGGELDRYRPPAQALQIPPAYAGIPLITAAHVAAAHRLGIEVHAWTINDEAEMEALLDLGVDGIVSDFPALAAKVAARRGDSLEPS